MEKREPSYAVAGNVNWCSHCREQYGGSSKTLKRELAYDPAIPLLAIHPDKAIVQKDACSILKNVCIPTPDLTRNLTLKS